MLKNLTWIAAGLAVAAVALQGQRKEETPDSRLQAAADVFHEMMAAPDKGIPHNLLEKAQCVVIVPGLKKGAFLVGGDYGKGYSICRHDAGWTGPAAITVGGGSFGAQIGYQSTDLILLVMHRKGMQDLLKDKVELGGTVSAAAGPIGRSVSADTNATLRSEILAWSRAHGIFAGASVHGMYIKKDAPENRRLYGHAESNRAILTGQVPAPRVAEVLTRELDRYPKARS